MSIYQASGILHLVQTPLSERDLIRPSLCSSPLASRPVYYNVSFDVLDPSGLTLSNVFARRQRLQSEEHPRVPRFDMNFL